MVKDKNIVVYYEIKEDTRQLVDIKYINKSDNPMDYQGDYPIYQGSVKNQRGNIVTTFAKLI